LRKAPISNDCWLGDSGSMSSAIRHRGSEFKLKGGQGRPQRRRKGDVEERNLRSREGGFNRVRTAEEETKNRKPGLPELPEQEGDRAT